jgi:cob(I)alamin adenosyltransferase
MIMRITRVYTRTGDKGTTGLADGSRVPKTSPRLECYGTIDELNALLGVCRMEAAAELRGETGASGSTPSPRETILRTLDSWLEAIQNDLFNLGADFATPIGGRWKNMLLVDERDVTALEKMIDHCQDALPPLREFVLPGGSKLNAYLHLARTVCRRAERHGVHLQEVEEVNPQGLPYLNRLSDLLFVLSRWILPLISEEGKGETEGGAGPAPREVTWSKEKGVRALSLPPSN